MENFNVKARQCLNRRIRQHKKVKVYVHGKIRKLKIMQSWSNRPLAKILQR